MDWNWSLSRMIGLLVYEIIISSKLGVCLINSLSGILIILWWKHKIWGAQRNHVIKNLWKFHYILFRVLRKVVNYNISPLWLTKLTWTMHQEIYSHSNGKTKLEAMALYHRRCGSHSFNIHKNKTFITATMRYSTQLMISTFDKQV